MSAAAALTGIMMGSGMPKQDYAPTLKQKVFARFFDHIGMGDHAAIINVIVTKVGGGDVTEPCVLFLLLLRHLRLAGRKFGRKACGKLSYELSLEGGG